MEGMETSVRSDCKVRTENTELLQQSLDVGVGGKEGKTVWK